MGLEDFIEILSTHDLSESIDEILMQVSRRAQEHTTFSDDLSLLEVYLD